jgi:hypothetical protein
VPIVIEPDALERFAAATHAEIDVAGEHIRLDGGEAIPFALDELRKAFILGGGFLPYLASKIATVRAWEAACRA